MFELAGKRALVTGAARGQGRSHAVALARAGVDVAVCDLCGPLDTYYPDATLDQLEETKKLVEAEGRTCHLGQVDVRDAAATAEFTDQAVRTLGGLDILVANAGILEFSPFIDLDLNKWSHMIDTNLTGVYTAMRAVARHMIEAGSGRIIATSSMAGRQGYGGIAHYTASKWGVIGLVKDVAIELGPHEITVNALCPTNVNTDMVLNEPVYRAHRPDLDAPQLDDVIPVMSAAHPQAVPFIEPTDVSAAVCYLASDEAKHVTGEVLTISAGLIARNTA